MLVCWHTTESCREQLPSTQNKNEGFSWGKKRLLCQERRFVSSGIESRTFALSFYFRIHQICYPFSETEISDLLLRTKRSDNYDRPLVVPGSPKCRKRQVAEKEDSKSIYLSNASIPYLTWISFLTSRAWASSQCKWMIVVLNLHVSLRYRKCIVGTRGIQTTPFRRLLGVSQSKSPTKNS